MNDLTESQKRAIQWLSAQDGCSFRVSDTFAENTQFVMVVGDPYDDLAYYITRRGKITKVQ